MATPQAQTKLQFRFRISTALICFGLVFLPWSSYYLNRPTFLDEEGFAASTFNFVVYHFSGSFLFLGFVAAFGALCWFAYKRHWRAVVQSLLEMVVCVGGTIFLPAY
jgi:hypothetical protein